jgi:hypothetical protein
MIFTIFFAGRLHEMESQRNLIEQIRRQLALPMNRRTNFLRKRLPGGGSCL